MLSHQEKEQDRQWNLSSTLLFLGSLFQEQSYQILSSEIPCIETQNNELTLNEDEGDIYKINELNNDIYTPQLQEYNEEGKVVLDLMDADIFVIHDVTTSIEVIKNTLFFSLMQMISLMNNLFSFILTNIMHWMT